MYVPWSVLPVCGKERVSSKAWCQHSSPKCFNASMAHKACIDMLIFLKEISLLCEACMYLLGKWKGRSRKMQSRNIKKSQGWHTVSQGKHKDWLSTVFGIWSYPRSVVMHFISVGCPWPFSLHLSFRPSFMGHSLLFLQSLTPLGLEDSGVCQSTVNSPFTSFLAPQASARLPLLQRSLPQTSRWVSVIAPSNNST